MKNTVVLAVSTVVTSLFFFPGCNSKQEVERTPVSRAQQIVDSAILAAGGDRYEHMKVEFDFRDRHYVGERNGGIYQYERIFTDSTGSYRDILNNNGFVREKEGAVESIPDSMAFKYANSVNSVLYFALLPYGLNDPAVNKEYLGMSNVKGKDYYKVKIWFDQEGGGKDFEDVFIYWIEKNSYLVDYLGYTYKTEGGGARFRAAYNPVRPGGVYFQDYINYKAADGDSTAIEDYDSLYEVGQLEELSRIELKNIKVTPQD